MYLSKYMCTVQCTFYNVHRTMYGVHATYIRYCIMQCYSVFSVHCVTTNTSYTTYVLILSKRHVSTHMHVASFHILNDLNLHISLSLTISHHPSHTISHAGAVSLSLPLYLTELPIASRVQVVQSQSSYTGRLSLFLLQSGEYRYKICLPRTRPETGREKTGISEKINSANSGQNVIYYNGSRRRMLIYVCATTR